nr:sigma-70 family RNA polymerase sigma factor [Rubeoparvulum massiliense]
MQQVLAGEPEAYRQLVESYQGPVYGAVFGVLRDPTWARDVTTQVFVRAYYALPRYEGQGFKTWLMRIAVNLAIDEKRKEERQVRLSLLVQGEPTFVHTQTASPEQQVLVWEQEAEMQRRLSELPAGYREVLVAYYFEEKTYQEIAEELQVTVKTVETKLYRARQWVRKHWRKEEW